MSDSPPPQTTDNKPPNDLLQRLNDVDDDVAYCARMLHSITTIFAGVHGLHAVREALELINHPDMWALMGVAMPKGKAIGEDIAQAYLRTKKPEGT